MRNALFDLIIDYVLFLELSSNDVVNPDVAIKKLEDIASQIEELESGLRRELVLYATQTGARSASLPLSGKEALRNFFHNIPE